MHLSIVIPTLGRHRQLSRILASLVKQVGHSLDVEVIVICNPDNEKISTLVQSYRGFGIPVEYRSSCELGTNRARNSGARLSRGKYLLFLDDDTCPPDNLFLGRLAQLISRSSFDRVAGGYYLSRSSAGFATKIYNAAANLWLFRPQYLQCDDFNLVGGCLLVAREVFMLVGGFDEVMQGGGEEREFCDRLFALGVKPTIVRELVVFHDFQGGWGRLFINAFCHGKVRKFSELNSIRRLRQQLSRGDRGISQNKRGENLSAGPYLRLISRALPLEGGGRWNWKSYFVLAGLTGYYLTLIYGGLVESCGGRKGRLSMVNARAESRE